MAKSFKKTNTPRSRSFGRCEVEILRPPRGHLLGTRVRVVAGRRTWCHNDVVRDREAQGLRAVRVLPHEHIARSEVLEVSPVAEAVGAAGSLPREVHAVGVAFVVVEGVAVEVTLASPDGVPAGGMRQRRPVFECGEAVSHHVDLREVDDRLVQVDPVAVLHDRIVVAVLDAVVVDVAIERRRLFDLDLFGASVFGLIDVVVDATAASDEGEQGQGQEGHEGAAHCRLLGSRDCSGELARRAGGLTRL